MQPKQPEVALSMPEQKTIQPEMENQVQTETVETTEQIETKQPETQGSESPYEAQLAELRKRAEQAEAKLKEKDEIIENKNRAIETTKKKLKEVTPEDELEERLLKRLQEKQQVESVNARVSALTNDPAERDVILHHYNNSIVRTGNFEEDLKNAIAIANRDNVWEQKRNRALEERREEFMTSFAGTSLRGEGSAPRITDPILAQAAELIRAVNPKAVDFLGK